MRTAVFDIETDNLLEDVTQVWCAVVKEIGGDLELPVRVFSPDNIHSLCDYLSSFSVLIGHGSIGFDFPVLRKLYGWEYEGGR